jgi:trimethylamine:corrinoid methyltransferase-like protein
MLCHNYLFEEKVVRDKQFIHEGMSFHILITVDKHEKAEDAMAQVKIAKEDYLKEVKHEVQSFDYEYLGYKVADKFTEKIIESKGYSIIPLEEKIQTGQQKL